MMGAALGQAFMQGGPVAWSQGLFPGVPPEQFGAAMSAVPPQVTMWANMLAAMMGGSASSTVMPPAAPPAEEPSALETKSHDYSWRFAG